MNLSRGTIGKVRASVRLTFDGVIHLVIGGFVEIIESS